MSTPKMSTPILPIPKMSVPMMSTVPKCLFPQCLLCKMFQNGVNCEVNYIHSKCSVFIAFILLQNYISLFTA